MSGPDQAPALNISAARVLEALGRVVRNNALDDETPLGGITVGLSYSADESLYAATIEDECGAYAPTLEMAIVALGHLDEGENVTLNHRGEPVCGACNGAGCDDCENTGHNCDDAPTIWPEGGIVADPHDAAELAALGIAQLGEMAAKTLGVTDERPLPQDQQSRLKDHHARLQTMDIYASGVAGIVRALSSRNRGGA